MIQYQFRPMVGWPRPSTNDRKHRPFGSAHYTRTLGQLSKELSHLRAKSPVIIEAAFREHEIRLDGMPRSDAGRPSHPGISINAETKFGPLRWLCDDCHHWQDNIRAIVLTLERLRLADRYGVTRRGEQYTGWRTLPPPGQAMVTPPAVITSEMAARAISRGMGLAGTDIEHVARNILGSADTARTCYRAAAKRLHPDANSTAETSKLWHDLQKAWAVLKAHHGGGRR
jgi:hypothetical protein